MSRRKVEVDPIRVAMKDFLALPEVERRTLLVALDEMTNKYNTNQVLAEMARKVGRPRKAAENPASEPIKVLP